jgi:hypothetical protein
MPTVLEMALLSMDVYEKKSGGLNQTGGVGQFSLGVADSGLGGYFAQAYTFSGGTVIAYRGTDSIADVIFGWPGGIGGASTRSPDQSKRRNVGRISGALHSARNPPNLTKNFAASRSWPADCAAFFARVFDPRSG